MRPLILYSWKIFEKYIVDILYSWYLFAMLWTIEEDRSKMWWLMVPVTHTMARSFSETAVVTQIQVVRLQDPPSYRKIRKSWQQRPCLKDAVFSRKTSNWQSPRRCKRTDSGWWLGHPSEKYEFVNWDDDIPNINGKIKFMATSHHQRMDS